MLQTKEYIKKQAAALAGMTIEALAEDKRDLLVRLAAIPGVEHVSDQLGDVPTVDAEGQPLEDEEIDLKEAVRLKLDCAIRVAVLPRHIVVGGLIQDYDAESPISEDGCNGRLLHAENPSEREEMRRALGLNEDGELEIDHAEVHRRMVVPVSRRIAEDIDLCMVLAAAHRTSGTNGTFVDAVRRALAKDGSREAFDDVFGRGAALPASVHGKLESIVAHAKHVLSRKVLKESCFGDPMAFALDIYDHGGRHYSFSSEGMQCRWDTSRGAAMWIPDDEARRYIVSDTAKSLGLGEVAYRKERDEEASRLMITLDGVSWKPVASYQEACAELEVKAAQALPARRWRKALREHAHRYAKALIEEYNAWCNGDVYGVCVYVIDRITGERIEEDECWGYIGTDYAESELDANVFHEVTTRLATRH